LLPFEITRTDSSWFCSTGTRANRGWSRITSNTSIRDCGDWPPVRAFGSSARLASCQECHGSQIQMQNAPEPNITRFASLSINCESCHGAGKRHQELMRAGAKGADIGMRALGTLSRDESVLLCMRCHAIKSDVRRGYLSGQSLDEFYSLKLALLGGDETHPDGRTKTFAYQQGHYYSDCYLSGSMTCVDCHAPHNQRYRDINHRELPGRFADAQCTDCHAAKAVQPELHTRHKANSEGSRCVSCHMPFVQESAVGPEIRYTRSDHTIGNPRADLDQQLGIANACRNCHMDRSTEQIAQETRRLWGELKPLRPIVSALLSAQSNNDLERAILAGDTTHGFAYFEALARYFSGLERADARAISRKLDTRLWELTESRDDDLAAIALAVLHFDGGATPRVRERLSNRLRAVGTRDLRVRRRWAIALGQRADALRSAGRHADALPVYGKALELLPEESDFLLAYGVTQLAAGDPVGSSETLRRAAVVDERNSLIQVNYGRARVAAGDESGALEAYRKAAQVNPYDGLAFFNLGNSLFRQEKRDSAEVAYRRAAELDPSLSPAQFNLARLLLLQGKEKDALQALRAGLVFDPNHAEARAAATQLENQITGKGR
jgi:tetratricopeptide (TPR) repeat protein